MQFLFFFSLFSVLPCLFFFLGYHVSDGKTDRMTKASDFENVLLLTIWIEKHNTKEHFYVSGFFNMFHLFLFFFFFFFYFKRMMPTTELSFQKHC